MAKEKLNKKEDDELEEDLEQNDESSDEDENGKDESSWGFEEGKPKMATETKIGLALILLLLAAFSFVVYKKLNPNNKILAKINEKIETLKPEKKADTENDLLDTDLLGQSTTGIETADSSSSNQDPFGSSATLDNSFSSIQKNAVQTVSQTETDTSNPFYSNESTESNQNITDQNESPFGAEQQEPNPLSQQENSFQREDPFGSNINSQTSQNPFDSGKNQAQQSSESSFGLDEETDNPFGAAEQSSQAQQNQNISDFSQNQSQQPAANTEYNPFESDTEIDSKSASNKETSQQQVTDIFGNPIYQQNSPRQNSIDQKTDSFSDQNTNSFNQSAADEAIQQYRGNDADLFPASDSADSSFNTQQPENNSQSQYGQYQAIDSGQKSASSSTTIQRADPLDGAGDTFDSSSAFSDEQSTMSQQNIDQSIDIDKPLSQSNQSPYQSNPDRSIDYRQSSQSQNTDEVDPFDSSSSDQDPFYGQNSSAQSNQNFNPDSQSTSSFNQTTQQSNQYRSFDSSSSFQNRSTTTSNPNSDIYIIEPNDSYWKISKKQYGTARYFQALALYNKERISDPRRMRPGMKILTPSRQILESRYPKLLPQRSDSTTNSSFTNQINQSSTNTHNSRKLETAGFFTSTEGRPMYRIGRTDTLSDISQKHLGRSSRWIQIFHMNKDQLKDPHNLKVGTVLRLPADASRISLLKRSGNIR